MDQLKQVEKEIRRLLAEKIGNSLKLFDFRSLGQGETACAYALVMGRQLTVRVLSESATAADLAGSALQKLIECGLAPSFLFLFPAEENSLGRDILVMEEATGSTLTAGNFNDQVFSDLVVGMLQLHRCRRNDFVFPADLLALLRTESIMVQEYLEAHLPNQAASFAELVTNLEYYLIKNETVFSVRQSLIHGDLYWSNMLVLPEGRAVLIDWLGLKYGDYCLDLATFKAGFLRCASNGECFGEGVPIAEYCQRMLEIYRHTFGDLTLDQRLRFYLPLVYIGDVYATLRGAQERSAPVSTPIDDRLAAARGAFEHRPAFPDYPDP